MGVLNNLILTSAGDVGPRPDQLKKWVDANGGKWAPRVQKGVTHLICSKEVWKKEGDAVVQAAKFGAYVLSYDWLEDSLQAKRKLAEKKYLWKAIRKERRKVKKMKRVQRPADTLKFNQGCRTAREDTGSGAYKSHSDSDSDPCPTTRRSGRPGFFVSSLEQLKNAREERKRKEQAKLAEERKEKQEHSERTEDVINHAAMVVDKKNEIIDLCGTDDEDEQKEGEEIGADQSSRHSSTSPHPTRSDARAASRSISTSSQRNPSPAPVVTPSEHEGIQYARIVSPAPTLKSKFKSKGKAKAKSKASLLTPPPSAATSSSQSKSGLPSFVAATPNPARTSTSTPSVVTPSPDLPPDPQPEVPKTERLTDNHHIFLDNGGFNYDIILIRSHLYHNSHDKYSLKLFESNTTPHTYCVFVRYEPAPPPKGEEKEVTLNSMGVPILKPAVPVAGAVPEARFGQQGSTNSMTTSPSQSQNANTYQHPALVAARSLVQPPSTIPPANGKSKSLIVPLNSPFEEAFQAFRSAFQTLTFLSWDERQHAESKALQLQRARIFNLEPFMYIKPKFGLPIGMMPPLPVLTSPTFKNELGLPGMNMPLSRECSVGNAHFRDLDMQRRAKEEEEERVRLLMEMKHRKNKGKKRGLDSSGSGRAVFYSARPNGRQKNWQDVERRMPGRW